MANSENSDVRVLVGVDPASASLIEKDILDLLSKISEKKYKVKIQADVSQFEKELDKITKGSKSGSKTKDWFNLRSAESEVKKVSAQVEKVRNDLKGLSIKHFAAETKNVETSLGKLTGLVEAFNNATNREQKKNILTQIREEMQKISSQKAGLEGTMKQITSLEKGFSTLGKKIDTLGKKTDVSAMLQEYQNAVREIENIKGLAKNGSIDLLDDSVTQRVNNLINLLDQLKKKYNDANATSKTGSGKEFNLDSANKKVEAYTTKLISYRSQLNKMVADGASTTSEHVSGLLNVLENTIVAFNNSGQTDKQNLFDSIVIAADNADNAMKRFKSSKSVVAEVSDELNSLEKKVAKTGLSAYGDNFATQLTTFQSKFKDFKDSIASGVINLNSDDARDELDRLVRQFELLREKEAAISSTPDFGANINKGAKTASQGLKILLTQLSAMKSILKDSALGLAAGYFAGRALGKIKQNVELVYQNVVKIDSALAQLQVVTGASGNQLEMFFDSAAESAKNLGTTVTEMLSSIETFSRLGYGLEDSLTLSSAATIMSNTAAVNVDEATTGITSIIKGYGLQVEDSERVTDVLVEVGRKYAISAGELMEAFQRGGAALYATGTDFEKSAALFAAANASIQNASTVGTALKAVSARIRGAKSELEEMGEDATDVAEGFSKYREEIMALTNVGGSGGFDIMADVETGKYKDIYEIFVGLSEVWDQLSDTTQARVAEILGGTRQLSVISSILNNIGDATGAYADAMGAAGTAAEANAIVMETAEKKIEQFKTTFETMSRSILDDDLVKGTIDFGTGFLEFLDKVIDKVGALPVLFAGAGIVDLVKHFGNSNEFAPYGCEAIAA